MVFERKISGSIERMMTFYVGREVSVLSTVKSSYKSEGVAFYQDGFSTHNRIVK